MTRRTLLPTTAWLGIALLAACSDGGSGSRGGAAAPAPAAAPVDARASSAAAQSSAPAESGWTVLLDGTSLDGWRPIGEANWRPVDGAVQADAGKGGFLVSAASYRDFELRAEFWADSNANSGIFLRCSDPAQITAANAYEVNIFDKRPDQTYRTGAIVDVAPPLAAIDAANRWNDFAIVARGTHLTVTLNGTTTVDTENDKLAEGPIALQYGTGSVKFKNVRIRPL